MVFFQGVLVADYKVPWKWWIKASFNHGKDCTSKMVTSTIENITTFSHCSATKTTRLQKEGVNLICYYVQFVKQNAIAKSNFHWLSEMK